MRLVLGFTVMAGSAAAQDLPQPLTDADFKPAA